MTRLLPSLFLLLLAGCTAAPSGSNQPITESFWTPPPAGTIIAADSMKITGDPLNNFYFSVQLSVGADNAGEQTTGFKYDVHARYGHATAEGQIVMPYGGRNLQPLLRSSQGLTYIIGFIPGAAYDGDTVFHEYYRVTGSRDGIEIKALKGFTVQ